jgi:hypothetical protein
MTVSTDEHLFDRQRCEARLREACATERPISIGAYDRVRFSLAWKQYDHDPSGLTDDDLDQLTLVDQALGDRARAARVGFAAAESESDRRLAAVPVSLKMLTEWYRDHVGPYVATIRYKAREAHTRIDALEQRLAALEAGINAAPPGPVELKSITARLERLEAVPPLTYCGVYRAGVSYAKGSAVTWAGSLWMALESTDAKPGEAALKSRAWALAVKRGNDGHDGKDARSVA